MALPLFSQFKKDFVKTEGLPSFANFKSGKVEAPGVFGGLSLETISKIHEQGISTIGPTLETAQPAVKETKSGWLANIAKTLLPHNLEVKFGLTEPDIQDKMIEAEKTREKLSLEKIRTEPIITEPQETESKIKDVWDAASLTTQSILYRGKQYFYSALPNLIFREPDKIKGIQTEKAARFNEKMREIFQEKYVVNELKFEKWLRNNPELQPREGWEKGTIETIKENPAVLKDPYYWGYQAAQLIPYTVGVMGTVAGVTFATGNPMLGIGAAIAITTPIVGQDLYEDLKNEGATDQQAAQLVGIMGPAISSVEVISDLPIMKMLGIDIFYKALRKEATKEIAKLTAKQLIKKGVKTFFTIQAIETMEEIVQEVMQNATVKTVNANRSLFENIPEVAVTTIMGMTPLSLFGGAKVAAPAYKATIEGRKADLIKMGYTEKQATALASQGGFAKVPGMPKSLDKIITEEAKALQGMEEGLKGGFKMGAEGKEIRGTEHSPAYSAFYKEHGYGPKSLENWKEIAQTELEAGKSVIGQAEAFRAIKGVKKEAPEKEIDVESIFAETEEKIRVESPMEGMIRGAMVTEAEKTEFLKTLSEDVRSGIEKGRGLTPAEAKKVGKAYEDFLRTGGAEKRMITLPEVQLLKDRIRTLARGAREGTIVTKAQIKETQEELISIVKSLVPLEERGKFLDTIKNIQTPEQLAKSLPDIENRISQLVSRQEARDILDKINKELKYTKPVKEGQKSVGKYDYESNKFFETLREYNKLTQERAIQRLELLPTEELTEIDLIKTRFLELKANGAKASLSLHEAVLNDIQRMKETGRQAKDEVDFIKRMERRERIDEMSAEIERIKGDKKSWLTKMENIYRLGFTNIYSILSTMVGKPLAMKYDIQLIENKKDTAIYQKNKELMTDVIDVLEVKNERAALNEIQNMKKQEFVLTDKEGVLIDIGKLEIMDIYNSIKNELVKERYYNTFGKEQIDTILTNLSQKEMALADRLQEMVQDYRDVLNQRSIETTGRDLGFVENYWPATSEFQQDFYDDIRIQGETPSAMKQRAKSANVIPAPRNAWLKALKHLTQAEHVQHISKEYETLNRIFKDRKIKSQIQRKFGDNVYYSLMDHINNLSLNRTVEKTDAIGNVYDNLLNNWVKAKIFSPTVFARQLVSFLNYSESISSVQFTKHFVAGLISPKATFDYIWKNNPWLETRFNKGYSEALRDVLTGVDRMQKNQGRLTKVLTTPTRAGDILPIVYGGYAFIKSKIAEGMNEQKAFKEFERQTLQSQQAGLTSSLSHYQNSSNPFAKTLLRFKNTINQYIRKQGDAIINYRNGDISKEQLAKITVIYSILNPMLYIFAGWAVVQGFKGIFGTDDDDKEEKLVEEMFMQMATNPFQVIPILDGISQYAYRSATGMDKYNVLSTPMLDDIESALRKLTKKEPTLTDYLEAMSKLQEPLTSIPTDQVLRYFKYMQPEEKKSKKGGESLEKTLEDMGLPSLNGDIMSLPELPKLPSLPGLPPLR